MLRIEKVV